MSQDINEKVLTRIEQWKTDNKSPKLEINFETPVTPDNDKSLIPTRMGPSPKVQIAIRYRIQGKLNQQLNKFSTDKAYNLVQANFIEADIYEECTSAADYQSICLRWMKFFKDQEKLLPSMTLIQK